MESSHQPEMQRRKRHGCVTAWLILMILVNAATMCFSFFLSFNETYAAMTVFPKWIYVLFAVLSVLNVVFAIFLLKWQRWAFWGFLATSVFTMGINIYTGSGILQSLVGLFGVGILYAILQIKDNGRSAWENLE